MWTEEGGKGRGVRGEGSGERQKGEGSGKKGVGKANGEIGTRSGKKGVGRGAVISEWGEERREWKERIGSGKRAVRKLEVE